MSTKKKNKVIGIILIVAPIVLLMVILTAYAVTSYYVHNLANSLPDGQLPTGDLGENDLRTTVGSVVNVVLGFLGILCIVMIPVGVGLGIYFLTKKEAVAPAVAGVPVLNETPEVKQEYAGFWMRVAAYIIDAILIAIVTQLIASGLSMVLDLGVAAVANTLIGLVGTWLYYALMEASENQGTLGKMALGIKVTDVEGKRIGFGRATGRHFAKFVSNLTLGIGFLMIAWTEKKQGLHDLIAGALVVRK